MSDSSFDKSYEERKAAIDAMIPDDGLGGADSARDLIMGATIIEELIEDKAFRITVCLIAAAMFRRHSFLELGTSEGRRAAENVGKVGDALATVGHSIMNARAFGQEPDFDDVWEQACKAMGDA